MTPTERAELRRIGNGLIAMADGTAVRGVKVDYDPLLAAARREVLRRASRAKVVPDQLLGEPAWDILLDLFVAEGSGQRVSVTSLSIASGCPATTGLRYIAALESDGLVVREPDPADGRRRFVRLSAKGRSIVAGAMHNHVKAEDGTNEVTRSAAHTSATMVDEFAHQLGVSLETVMMHRANFVGQSD